MKKIHGSEGLFIKSFFTSKILKVMRITMTLLFLATLQLFAGNSYSQSARLTLNLQNTSVDNILDEIEQQSEFFFVFNYKLVDVDRPVDIQADNKPISEVLASLFSGSDVDYVVLDRQILLAPKSYLKEVKSKIQPITVTGTVSDEDGNPIPGVNIVVKGTTQGNISDANGQYTIAVDDPGATLVFSFIGMLTQEVQVGDQTEINITMEQDAVGLEEVVAIGYGTVKKQDLTGSISKVNSEAFQERSITTLGEGLAGQIAGVRISESTGAPGSEMRVNIRGVNSITAGNAPLYIIDGISVGSMTDLNPNDVESIQVLKDASSTAIYGARGANGVVLITSKQGKKGKPTFNFEASYGLQKVDETLDMMNRDEYIAFNSWAKNYVYIRNGGSMSDPMSSRPANRRIYDSWLEPEKLPDTDWFESIYRIAPIQRYSLNVSGGGDRGTYLISAGLMDQEGIMVGTGYERANLRLNTTLNVGNNVQVGMNIAPSFSVRNVGGSETHNIRAATMSPMVPIDGNTMETGYTTDGAFPWANPVETLKQTNNTDRNAQVQSNIWGKWDITKSLSFKSQFGYNYADLRNTYFSPKNINHGMAETIGSFSLNQSYYSTLQNTMNYKFDVEDLLDVDLLLGQSIERTKGFLGVGSATNYPNDLIQTLNVAATKTDASTYESENTMASFFGRMLINAKDKYLLSLSARYDGSSRFGENTKWGWFPSASTAWKINKESFMENVGWINLLKLRVMLGKSGNNNIGNYEYISRMGVSNYNLGGKIVSGLATTSIVNPDLGWETKSSKGVGLDFNGFNNRVQMSVDYYNEMTTDMLLNANVSHMTGFNSIRDNIGSVLNRGWEFELTTTNIDRQVKWRTTINLSTNVNEVKALGVDDAPIINYLYGVPVHKTQVGDAVGSFYLYKSDGILLPKDFDAEGNALVPVLAGQEPGNVKVVDVNGDGKIDPDDRTIVGNNYPDLFFGLNNQITYKNFDLNIFLDGQLGSEVYFIAWRYVDNGADFGFNSLSHWVHCYKPETPGENPIPDTDVDMSWDGKTKLRYGNNADFSDNDLYDASFLRIRSITLGYNLPKQACKKIGCDKIRFYANAFNPFTWDNYYLNPETYSATWGPETTAPGVDFVTYSVARRYSLGIVLTF